MKLRSAQFVLLVLLFSSLSLSEGSSLRLADELIGSAVGIRLTQRAPAGNTVEAGRFSARTAAPAVHQQMHQAQRETLAQAWTMPHPAAHAASLQANHANARAEALRL